MKKVVLFVLMSFLALGGYAQYSYGIDEARDSIEFAKMRVKMDSVRQYRPTVALVLSGGGAKGAAQVRVLQYLEQLKLPIDMVLGTSIGGLIGGLYSCGYKGAEVEALLGNLNWEKLLTDVHPRTHFAYESKHHADKYALSFPIDSCLKSKRFPTGVVDGQNVTNLLASLLVGYEDELDFFDLPIPFVCVGADVISTKPKIWHSGNLITAMRSTMSIPVLFAPVRTEGMVLIDGGMLNNYPIDIAKKMGADIVVGIDISSPSYTYDEVNNIVDVIMQITDIPGRKTYERNFKLSDINICPDISNYNMLSFTAESIADMINIGDTAAQENAHALNVIKAQVGNDTLKYQDSRAISLRENTVAIDSVEIVGVTAREKDYLMHLADVRCLRSSKKANYESLERAVASLYGTRSFSSVTYRVLGKEPPYRVQFSCIKGTPHQLSIGAHFDTEELTSILLYFGFNANRLEGHAFDITGRLGMNSWLRAHYRYKTPAKADVNAALSIKNVMRNRFEIESLNFELNYFNARAEAYLSLSQWTNAVFEAGATIDYYSAKSPLTNYPSWPESIPFVGSTNTYLSVFARVAGDTFDDGYFPHHGSSFMVHYEWYLAGLKHSIDNFHAVQGHFKKVAFDINHWALIPYANIRFLLGDSIAMPFHNSICVSNYGRDIEQQIPFVGISEACPIHNIMGILGLDLRYQFFEKHFITARANVLQSSDKFRTYFNPDKSTTALGFAIEYAYKSMAGPMKFDVHWNSLTKSVGVYLSLGFEF